MDTDAWISAHFEKDIMKRLRHPNILPVEDFFEDHDYMCIVIPKMEMDLRAYIRDVDRPLKEDEIRKIFFQMVFSVMHCHKNSVIHRDIKLENFLIQRNNY